MLMILQNALQFIVLTAIDLYAFILILRFMLALSNASHNNPVTQFVIQLTGFIVRPIRKIIPNIYRVETASLILTILLEMLRFYVFALFTTGTPHVAGIAIVASGVTLGLIIQVFFYAIILQVLVSWLKPTSPYNMALRQFTSPILNPLQRIVPLIAGFDITPLLGLIFLNLMIIVLVDPIKQFGLTLW